MTFPMTLDRCQRTLTLLVLLGVLLSVLTVLAATHRALPVLAVLAVTVAALAIAAAYAPSGVQLMGGELRVLRRRAAPVRLSLADLLAVEDGPDGCDFRLLGAHGFLGTFGLYWTRGLGKHWLYATRRGKALAIRRRGGLPLVLVVDDSEGLRLALARWRRQTSLRP